MSNPSYYLFPTFGLKSMEIADTSPLASPPGGCSSGYILDPIKNPMTDGFPTNVGKTNLYYYYNNLYSSASTIVNGTSFVGQTYNIDPQSLYPGGAATYYGDGTKYNSAQPNFGTNDPFAGADTACFERNTDGNYAKNNRSLNVCSLYATSTVPSVTNIGVDTTGSSSCTGFAGSNWTPVPIYNAPCQSNTNTTFPIYHIAYTNEFPNMGRSSITGQGGPNDSSSCAQLSGGYNSSPCASLANTINGAHDATYGNLGNAIYIQNFQKTWGVTTTAVCPYFLNSSVCWVDSCSANYTVCYSSSIGEFPVQRVFVDFNYDDCDAAVCTPPSNGPYYCTVPQSQGQTDYQRIQDNDSNVYDFFAGCATGEINTSGTFSPGHAYLCRDNPTANVPSGSPVAPYQVLSSSTSCLTTGQYVFYVAGPGNPAPNSLMNAPTSNGVVCVRVVNNYQIPPQPLPNEENFGNAISNRTTYALTYFSTPNGSYVIGGNDQNATPIVNSTTKQTSSGESVTTVNVNWSTAGNAFFLAGQGQVITMLSEQYDTLLFAGVEEAVVAQGQQGTLFVYALQYLVPTAAALKAGTITQTPTFQVLGSQPSTANLSANNFLFSIANYAPLTSGDSFRLVPLSNSNAQVKSDIEAQFGVLVLDITNPGLSQYYDNTSQTVVPMNSNTNFVNVTYFDGTTSSASDAFANCFSSTWSIVYVNSTFGSPSIDILYYDTSNLPANNSFNPSTLTLTILPTYDSSSGNINSLQVTVVSPTQFPFALSNRMNAAYPDNTYINYTFASGIDYSKVYWFGLQQLISTDECKSFCANGTLQQKSLCYNNFQTNMCGENDSLLSMNCEAMCYGTGVISESGGTLSIASSGVYNCVQATLEFCKTAGNASSVCACYAGTDANLANFFSQQKYETLANYKTFGLDSRYENYLESVLDAIGENPYCSNSTNCNSQSTYQNTEYSSCSQQFNLGCLECITLTQDSEGNNVVEWTCDQGNQYTQSCDLFNKFCYVYNNSGLSCGNNVNPSCTNCKPPPPTPWYLQWKYLIVIGAILFVFTIMLVLLVVPKKTPLPPPRPLPPAIPPKGAVAKAPSQTLAKSKTTVAAVTQKGKSQSFQTVTTISKKSTSAAPSVAPVRSTPSASSISPKPATSSTPSVPTKSPKTLAPTKQTVTSSTTRPPTSR